MESGMGPAAAGRVNSCGLHSDNTPLTTPRAGEGKHGRDVMRARARAPGVGFGVGGSVAQRGEKHVRRMLRLAAIVQENTELHKVCAASGRLGSAFAAGGPPGTNHVRIREFFVIRAGYYG